MELICLWIDGYKNLKNIFLSLNAKYACKHKYSKDENILNLSIEKNNDYYNIFPNDNINLITIVGANGCGKSSIINVLTDILRNKQSDIFNHCKYCLIMKNGEEFIYKKSDDININSLNFQIREQKIEVINGYPAGDVCNVLSYKPFLEDNFIYDSSFYTSYDEELRIQDQINNYFFYDRFPESTVAFTFSRALNHIKKLNVFQGEYKNILFEKFGWEFNLKDCYNHIVLRLRKHLRNSRSNSFPMSFPIVLHNSDTYYAFYEFVNKIKFFQSDKYDWNQKTTKIEDVLLDIIFFSAICQFGFYTDYIEKFLKNYYMPEFKANLNDGKNLGEIEGKKNSIVEEIFEKVLSNAEKNQISEKNLIEQLIFVVGDKNLKYNKITGSQVEGARKHCIDALYKIKNIIENPQILFDVLDEQYFYLENFTYKLNHKFRPFINDFIGNNNYDENTDDSSAIYINKYEQRINNDAVDEICKILPTDFISHYFHINLYKYINDEECYTFKDMSTGEQRLIKFFADIFYCKPRDVYLIDEIDMSWHPEWYRKLISSILEVFSSDKFEGKFINVILTTHSPIPLSDLPAKNIISLKKCEGKSCCEVYSGLDKTFASNIHTLFAKQFFLESTIGNYAESKIRSIVYSLSDEEQQKIFEKSGISLNRYTPQECKKIIELIGEDVYQKVLYDMYKKFNVREEI